MKDNNPFIFPLLNIKKQIEFCMDKEIATVINDPVLIQVLVTVHNKIEELFKE